MLVCNWQLYLVSGIGYFTLPYLAHAGASHVHACEWNPDAVEALQKNLGANRVSDRCTVHQGDNRQVILFHMHPILLMWQLQYQLCLNWILPHRCGSVYWCPLVVLLKLWKSCQQLLEKLNYYSVSITIVMYLLDGHFCWVIHLF